MTLYDRDFFSLNDEEVAEWEKIKKQEIMGDLDGMTISCSLFRQYPKAARHFNSYFPNHFLDPVDLIERTSLETKLNKFSMLLDSKDVGEREILNFIRKNQAYFLIASLFKYYHFGHHDAYLFPEFQLGNSYKADYLLVGLGSGGWEFVFVELEAPKGKITLKEGSLGDSFRKGLAQLENWSSWLEGSYSSLRETFEKYKNVEKTLPNEFTKLEISRIHFVIVSGRRNNFNDRTYRIQRNKLEKRIRIIHYDNIIDCTRNIIGQYTY